MVSSIQKNQFRSTNQLRLGDEQIFFIVRSKRSSISFLYNNYVQFSGYSNNIIIIILVFYWLRKFIIDFSKTFFDALCQRQRKRNKTTTKMLFLCTIIKFS